jgi:hypothetical protein
MGEIIFALSIFVIIAGYHLVFVSHLKKRISDIEEKLADKKEVDR